ncbi:putative bifunctional diguanylate cyclase/phosphodiesterase [Spiribacter vilamensis]|uniref:Diguanylate cyclase (GGDEF)-like protein n=1 Tax=Spiribacter vilamensis TaxID=531306 RepID=A0A4Q8D074_9GAMM|nr:EAL domain-containing protein [Spiribacter vilamensis]RZU98664.1 diguanylate cyclase (GGDEF)-like protein [Spiribacter vilamensis]TVO60079.1 EAL domain-containing protein [Spiribacter vilamensis]
MSGTLSLAPVVASAASGVVMLGGMAMLYRDHVRRGLLGATRRQLVLGGILGVAVLLVLHQPLEAAPGLLLNAAILFTGLAGLLAGGWGAIAALAIVLPARLLTDVESLVPGATTMAFIAAPGAGLLAGWIRPRVALTSPWSEVLSGVLLSLPLLAVVGFGATPREVALAETVPLIFAINMAGAVFVGWLGMDVEETTRALEEHRHNLALDPLTGLKNRDALEADIDAEVGAAPAVRPAFALVCLDIDNLKYINNALGFAVGDAVLCSIAQRLSMQCRTGETLYRLTGDKFAVLVASGSTEHLMQRGEAFLDALRRVHPIDDYDLLVTASVGIVVAPSHGRTRAALLENADIGVDQAKAEGRNRVMCFSREMRAALERKLTLTQALQHALVDGDELRIVFQPRLSARDGCVCGAEVLLRWRHPSLGDISPAEFIPLAERAGLVCTLDRLVFDRAGRQLAEWQRRGCRLDLSINVSALSLIAGHAAQDMLERLDRHGVDKRSVEIEVTETENIGDSKTVHANLRQFRAAGIRVALDDFGTGHSSLRYVQALPLSTLKIDRCFVADIDNADGKAVSILASSIALARALDLVIVAEGVETERQREWLIEYNCDQLQGFLLGRPIEADGFERHYLPDRGRQA